MTPAPTDPGALDAEATFAMWSVWISLGAFVVSLLFGIPSLWFAKRADERANRAEQRAIESDELAARAETRAENAEKLAERIDARAIEQHDVEWEYNLRNNTVPELTLSNIGRDAALAVFVVAEANGLQVMKQGDDISGGGGTVSIPFPHLTEELASTRRWEPAPFVDYTNTLDVWVSIRVMWTTPLGTPRAEKHASKFEIW